jgi:hypothetical protein
MPQGPRLMATPYTCSTCGRMVADLAAHQDEMAERRRRYGASWELESRPRYQPVADGGDNRDER